MVTRWLGGRRPSGPSNVRPGQAKGPDWGQRADDSGTVQLQCAARSPSTDGATTQVCPSAPVPADHAALLLPLQARLHVPRATPRRRERPPARRSRARRPAVRSARRQYGRSEASPVITRGENPPGIHGGSGTLLHVFVIVVLHPGFANARPVPGTPPDHTRPAARQHRPATTTAVAAPRAQPIPDIPIRNLRNATN